MSDLDITVTVTRTELNLGPLSVVPENGYYVKRAGIGVGETTFRRQTAESPFVRGSVLVHAVQDISTINPIIRVQGISTINLFNRIEVLTDAMTQFSYTLTFTIDGVQKSFKCEAADFSVGDGANLDDLMLRSYMQYVSLEVRALPL